MVDSILGNSTSSFPKAGMVARLKVGMPVFASPDTGMTRGEKQLRDIVDIGAGSVDRAQKLRELDAHLRLFQSVLKYINGTTARYAPAYTPVEIEYVKLENPYLKKANTMV